MVDFGLGFVPPEMVKRRPCVVISPPIEARGKLATVVALSTTTPYPVMPYHMEIDIPFEIPAGFSHRCWLKGDMINAVSFDRIDFLRLGKDRLGVRRYQYTPLPNTILLKVQECVLRGIGVPSLTSLA